MQISLSRHDDQHRLPSRCRPLGSILIDAYDCILDFCISLPKQWCSCIQRVASCST